jgi:hypothetical protein
LAESSETVISGRLVRASVDAAMGRPESCGFYATSARPREVPIGIF